MSGRLAQNCKGRDSPKHRNAARKNMNTLLIRKSRRAMSTLCMLSTRCITGCHEDHPLT